MKLLAFAVGIILLSIGAFMAIQALQFEHIANSAQGNVIALNAGGSHPEISFMVSDKKYNFPQGGFIFGYKTGDIVTVLYDPKNPSGTATLNNFGALWFAPALLSFIGLLFIAAALKN
jgi:hypothetical protein